MKKRKSINKFIKSSWTNMNIRAGKYRHLQTKNKCKIYRNIFIEFTRNEYKNWCLKQEQYILSLLKPSVDRIDNTKNYSLNNIQIINLDENIRKKRYESAYVNGPRQKLKRGISKCGNKFRARIKIKGKENHLGLFNTEKEAYEVFRLEYIKFYNKEPW